MAWSGSQPAEAVHEPVDVYRDSGGHLAAPRIPGLAQRRLRTRIFDLQQREERRAEDDLAADDLALLGHHRGAGGVGEIARGADDARRGAEGGGVLALQPIAHVWPAPRVGFDLHRDQVTLHAV